MTSTDSTFRILSIDGGGIRGILPAAFLSTIESETGRRVVDHFDLIAGTSTGGIIALALGLGISAEEIVGFYEKFGPEVFSQHPGRFSKIRHLFRPRYDSDKLRGALETVFANSKIGESKTRLVIPATDAGSGDVYIFKTAHSVKFSTDYKKLASEAAMATAAAPTFFRQFLASDGVRLLDGGLWANNPTMVAVVEAMSVLGRSANELRILSLGNATSPLMLDKEKGDKGGRLAWIQIAEWFLAGQSLASVKQAGLLVGKENLLRVEYSTKSGVYSLDDVKAASDLKGAASVLARKHKSRVEDVFLGTKAEPFLPYHNLEEEKGRTEFHSGKQEECRS
jgi:hypothetical protein